MLTSAPPVIAKGVVHVHGRSPFAALTRIGLEVDPRMSAAEVSRLYAKTRGWVRGGGDHEMTEKHLQLALFIAKDGSRTPHWLGMETESWMWEEAGRASRSKLAVLAPDSAEPEATWPELQNRWNRSCRETHPDWRYGDVYAGQFGRDAREAWKRLTGQLWWSPKTPQEHEDRQRKKPKGKRAS